MNLTDRDLERWLRAACPPIEPAPPLRRLVLAAAPRRRPAGRVLRAALPFAAGALCVLALESGGTGSDPSSPDSAVPAVIFERIADRAPPSAPVREGTPPRTTEVASAPVPRIS